MIDVTEIKGPGEQLHKGIGANRAWKLSEEENVGN